MNYCKFFNVLWQIFLRILNKDSDYPKVARQINASNLMVRGRRSWRGQSIACKILS